LIIQERGVIFSSAITRAERAMISGLAQVVQRIAANAPIRYLTEAEVSDITKNLTYRYGELANSSR
jgi:hypothetical protein